MAKEVPIFYGGFPGGDSFAEALRRALPSLNGTMPPDETPDQPLQDEKGVDDWRDRISRVPGIDQLNPDPENTL